MAERITSLDEIKDPEAFLKAYYKAMDELSEMRVELKESTKVLDELKESGSDENLAKWKDRALKQAVKSMLETEGIKNSDRILKYMSLEGVDFDDEKDILTGFDDKLKEVKTDFPELFDAKRRAGSSSADIHANAPANTAPDPVREAVRSAIG